MAVNVLEQFVALLGGRQGEGLVRGGGRLVWRDGFRKEVGGAVPEGARGLLAAPGGVRLAV